MLTDAGKIAEYRELFPQDYSAVRWYPMTDYLVRLAVAGALLESPEQVHHGMYEIGRRNASAFSDSLIGRTMLRLLARDPSRLLRQACAARRQSIEGGRWDVEFTSERRAEVSMHAEYVWIESNLVGAAVGTFESIGLGVTVEYELSSPYEGKHVLTW